MGSAVEIVHKIKIHTSAAAVFSIYKNITSWPQWDTEVQAVSLSNDLEVGSHGWLKPRNGPKAAIRVIKVVQGISFTIEGQLPLCRMEFDHVLQEDEQGTIAIHSVHFRGPLAFFFRRVIGKQIDTTLPDTLAGLKRASEQNRAKK
jgi:hypothetical protein